MKRERVSALGEISSRNFNGVCRSGATGHERAFPATMTTTNSIGSGVSLSAVASSRATASTTPMSDFTKELAEALAGSLQKLGISRTDFTIDVRNADNPAQ